MIKGSMSEMKTALNLEKEKQTSRVSQKKNTGRKEDDHSLNSLGWILFFTALIFFVAMGLWNLMHSDLWGDEWVEYTISMQSITNGQMYDSILTTFQPPLYNWLMHFWLKFNDSLLWFRLFNLIPAMASGCFLFFGLNRLAGKWWAFFGVLFLSVSFIWIYMLQECSEYTLMMAFVFSQLYFFIRLWQKYSRLLFAGFIICTVGAVYSQYGAVFACVPLAAALYIKVLLERNWRVLLEMTIGYGIALLVFAIPLYWFFARVQIANNEITEHINGSPTFWGYLSSFGLLIEYFMLYQARGLDGLFIVLGIVLLVLMIGWLIASFKKRGVIWALTLLLLVSYTLLYILVELHVYAMIHAGESRGLFFRYSDCVLPMFYTIVPLFFYGLSRSLKRAGINRKLISGGLIITLIFSGAIGAFGFTKIAANWSKSHESEFLQTWLDHDGLETPTLFLGRMAYNSRYYFEQNNWDTSLITEDLMAFEEQIAAQRPDSFFVLRTVWGGESELEQIREFAKAQGYLPAIEIEYEENGSLDYGGTLIEYTR